MSNKDENMSEKISDTVGNICTILGGALLLYPLIDQATKTIIPEMQKLSSGEATEGMKLLPESKEEKPEEKPEDSSQNEIAELKRRIAEYEEKEQSKEEQPGHKPQDY